MIEVEVKARLDRYEETRALVEAAGAGFAGTSEKRDHYYGPEGKSARELDFEKDPMFRIRSEGGKTIVATKRRDVPPEDTGGVEVNEEIEFEVNDPASFRMFAQAIGFRPAIVKRKQTRKYTLGRATIELHKVDPLGDFIEIEVLVDDRSEVAEAQAEVTALLERFQVPREKIEPRKYIDLLRRIGRGMPSRGE